MQTVLFFICGVAAFAASIYAWHMAVKISSYLSEADTSPSLISGFLDTSERRESVIKKYRHGELEDEILAGQIRRFLLARRLCYALTFCAFLILLLPGLLEAN